MRLALKVIGGLVVTVIVLTIAAMFVVTDTHWGHEQIRTRVVAALNNVAHGKVSIATVDGNLLHGITLSGVSITDSAGAPLITADSVQAGYAIRPFISRKIELSDIRFVRPAIVLDKSPNGSWNYERIFPVNKSGPKSDTTGIQFGDWLVFHNLSIAQGHLIVRLPWHAADSLKGRMRDSAIKAALDTATRLIVVQVPGGYQQIQEYRAINAHLPLARIAQPGFKTRLFTVDTASMTALAFAPPPAEVRQLIGRFETNSDSVWFDVAKLALPASTATLAGRYSINSGDLALHALTKQLALSDVRFLYPALPTDGTAALDLALNWVGKAQSYVVHDLDLKTGKASATGDIGITLGDTLKLHDTNVKFAGIDTKLIQQLVPGLQVPRRGVLSGRAKIDGALAAMKIDGDVTFIDSKTGLNRVLAVGEVGTSKGVVRTRDLHVTLSPVQTALGEMAMKAFPLRGTITGSTILNGATNTKLVASQLVLTHLENGERSHFTGNAAVGLGDSLPYLHLDVIADSLSLITAGKFAPSAGIRGNVAGPILLDGTTRNLAIKSSLHSSDGGLISANGKMDVASKDIGYDLTLITKLFNANLIAEKAPRTSLSAMLVARGRGFVPETMQADLDASVSTSTIDTLAVDSSRIRMRIAGGMATIDTFAVNVPGASADVKGTMGMAKTANGTLAYDVQVDSIGKLARYLPFDTSIVKPRPGPVAERLEQLRADSIRIAERLLVARAAGVAPQAKPVVIDTPPSFRRDSLAGSVKARGTVKGNINSFDLVGSAEALSIVALGNTVQKAALKYSWNGAMTDSALANVTANASAISASGFLLDSVAAHLTYAKPGGDARINIYQNTRRDYALNAKYALFPDSQQLTFDTLSFRFDSTRWATSRSGSVLWGKPGIELDSIDLRNNAGGRIFADGRLPTEGPSKLKLQITNFEVGDAMGLLESDLALRGLFSTDVAITGTSTAPVMVGKASLAKATFSGTDIPELQTTFNYGNQRLLAKADATYTGRQVAVADASVPINLATSGVTGSRLLDGESLINVKTDSLPLDLASKFTKAVTEVRGYAMGSAVITGPLSKPKIAGDLAVNDGAMRVTALGVKLLAMNGSVHVNNDSVIVDSISAYSGGRINITGGLGIATPATPSFDLNLIADNAKVLDDTTGRVRLNAQIAVKGPYDAVVVSGNARVREGVLYIPKPDTRVQLNTGDGAVLAVSDTSNGKVEGLVPGQSPLISNLKMDLTLAIDRDTWVRDEKTNVEIYSDGDLRINVDRRRSKFTLDGVVDVDRGEYEFQGKRFQIKRGSAIFVGTEVIDPILQVTGEYDLQDASQQGLKIQINIGGTLLAPRLTLASDAQPPIPQSDLLSYLAFGSQSGSLLQSGGSSVAGGNTGGGLVGTSAALASKQLIGVALGAAVSSAESQAGRSLGADVFNITPASIPPELASGHFGAFSTFLRSTQLEYGKYFTTSTFVGLNLQAINPGFRIEHRLGNNGLSLESTLQPRFFLPEPSLASQNLKKANAFGLFLVRRWKF
jgi:autotransporter translocation and assembly factor TamB